MLRIFGQQDSEQLPNGARVQEAVRLVDYDNARPPCCGCHVEHREYLTHASPTVSEWGCEIVAVCSFVDLPDVDAHLIRRNWRDCYVRDVRQDGDHMTHKAVKAIRRRAKILQYLGQVASVGLQDGVDPGPTRPYIGSLRTESVYRSERGGFQHITNVGMPDGAGASMITERKIAAAHLNVEYFKRSGGDQRKRLDGRDV